MKATPQLIKKAQNQAFNMKRYGETERKFYHYGKDYRLTRMSNNEFRLFLFNPDGLIDDLIAIITTGAAK